MCTHTIAAPRIEMNPKEHVKKENHRNQRKRKESYVYEVMIRVQVQVELRKRP